MPARCRLRSIWARPARKSGLLPAAHPERRGGNGMSGSSGWWPDGLPAARRWRAAMPRSRRWWSAAPGCLADEVPCRRTGRRGIHAVATNHHQRVRGLVVLKGAGLQGRAAGAGHRATVPGDQLQDIAARCKAVGRFEGRQRARRIKDLELGIDEEGKGTGMAEKVAYMSFTPLTVAGDHGGVKAPGAHP
jgi:hypothetical protein